MKFKNLFFVLFVLCTFSAAVAYSRVCYYGEMVWTNITLAVSVPSGILMWMLDALYVLPKKPALLRNPYTWVQMATMIALLSLIISGGSVHTTMEQKHNIRWYGFGAVLLTIAGTALFHMHEKSKALSQKSTPDNPKQGGE